MAWWLGAAAPVTGATLVASARGAGKQQLYVSRALRLAVVRQTGSTGNSGAEVRSRQDLYDIDDVLSLVLRGRIAGLDRDGDLIANARDAFPDMPTAWLDADCDGLGDRFERRIMDHDLDDDLTTLLDVRGGDDFDADGTGNLDEFLAGSDPTRPPNGPPERSPLDDAIWLPVLAEGCRVVPPFRP